jgi:DNA mismatch repair protein MutL
LPGAPQDSEPLDFDRSQAAPFHLSPRLPSPLPGRLPCAAQTPYPDPHDFDLKAWGEAARELFTPAATAPNPENCSPSSVDAIAYASDPAAETARVQAEQASANLGHLAALKPLGQLKESFILATGEDGLWIIDQHVAHERVLFEKILRQSQQKCVERQRLLMPLLVELKPDQMVVFARIAEELDRSGFDVEAFGPHTLAVKAAPAGLESSALERVLAEIVEQAAADSDQPYENDELTRIRTHIAATVACHAAIKVNTALDIKRIEWLLLELAKTSHPTSCPHGRPIALLYSWREILRAFHRI